MGDDRLVSVDRVHQLADDTILIDRNLLRPKLMLPILEPFGLDGGDLRRKIGHARAVAAALLARDLRYQRVEHKLCIACKAEVATNVLVHVIGIVRRVYNRLAKGQRRAKRRARQTGADGEHQVGLFHERRVHARLIAR